MQPRTVHLFNQRHQKLRVLGNAVVIFQMDDDVAGGGVFHDAKKRVRAAAEIGWLVVSRSDVSANAGRAQGGGGINPPLVVGDGPLALGTIGGGEAVASKDDSSAPAVSIADWDRNWRRVFMMRPIPLNVVSDRQLAWEFNSQSSSGGGAGGPGPLKIEAAEMTGYVDDFADEEQARDFAALHCFG